MKRPLRLVSVAAAFAVAFSVSVAPAANAAMSPDAFDKEVVRIVNAERTKRGLPKFKVVPAMGTYARAWSTTMARTGDFKHVTLAQLSSETAAAGCSGAYAENIAYSSGGKQESPRSVVTRYMNSPGHRAAILSKSYNYVASGSSLTGSTVYNTQRFASTCTKTVVKGWATSQRVKVKKVAKDTVAVPGGKRVVALQKFKGKKWVTVKKVKTSAAGRVRISMPERKTAGKVKYRLVVRAKGKYVKGVSKTKVLIYKK